MRYQPLPLAERITVHGVRVDPGAPPDGLRVLEEVGVLSVPGVSGQVIYRAPGSLFETRATVTPGGDYLLMFPTDSAGHDPDEGHCHYGRAERKVNDLVAFRSTDGGESGKAPTSRSTSTTTSTASFRSFRAPAAACTRSGTQPIWDRYRRDQGLRENAPIGYGGRTTTVTPGATCAYRAGQRPGLHRHVGDAHVRDRGGKLADRLARGGLEPPAAADAPVRAAQRG